MNILSDRGIMKPALCNKSTSIIFSLKLLTKLLLIQVVPALKKKIYEKRLIKMLIPCLSIDLTCNHSLNCADSADRHVEDLNYASITALCVKLELPSLPNQVIIQYKPALDMLHWLLYLENCRKVAI